MLQTLRIQNYALIDTVELEFGPGLNILTGETGAGKSIIVGALNLVLGARASSEVVREASAPARIDAAFSITNQKTRLKEILVEHEIELEDGELLLSRTVSAEGRSKAYANGRLIPVSLQSAIGDELVDLHGQHEHQSLLRADRQIDLLDEFAGLTDTRANLVEKVRLLRALDQKISEIESGDREQARRVDFLRFEASEIEKASLEPGEDAELRERRNLIANAENIANLSGGARRLLAEEENGSAAIDRLGAATRDLEELAEIDTRFVPTAERLNEILAEVDAIAGELLQHSEQVEFDPDELNTVNSRLSTIRELQRKYGATIEEVLVYRDNILKEIDAYENSDRYLAELTEQRDRVTSEAEGMATQLSKKRKRAAKALDQKVAASLQDLGMEGADFATQIEPGPLSLSGADRIEFLLSANAGQARKALKQVASGGEISRIMLALKGVFAEADTIPTLIFDEIDAGIGGAVATKVANRLRELAQSHQTICITHLPQIAAAGQTHYHVSKAVEDGETHTFVRSVDNIARIEEVARLLDGSVTDLSLDHARALLDELAS